MIYAIACALLNPSKSTRGIAQYQDTVDAVDTTGLETPITHLQLTELRRLNPEIPPVTVHEITGDGVRAVFVNGAGTFTSEVLENMKEHLLPGGIHLAVFCGRYSWVKKVSALYSMPGVDGGGRRRRGSSACSWTPT